MFPLAGIFPDIRRFAVAVFVQNPANHAEKVPALVGFLDERKPLVQHVSFYRRPGFLAMVALLLIFIGVGGSLWRGNDQAVESAQFTRAMLASLEKPFTLDLMSQNLEEVKDWLASNTLAERRCIPAALESYRPFGCLRGISVMD